MAIEADQSWWLGLDRAEFDARAAAELPRMQKSKFAGNNDRVYVNWDREERPSHRSEDDDEQD